MTKRGQDVAMRRILSASACRQRFVAQKRFGPSWTSVWPKVQDIIDTRRALGSQALYNFARDSHALDDLPVHHHSHMPPLNPIVGVPRACCCTLDSPRRASFLLFSRYTPFDVQRWTPSSFSLAPQRRLTQLRLWLHDLYLLGQIVAVFLFAPFAHLRRYADGAMPALLLKTRLK